MKGARWIVFVPKKNENVKNKFENMKLFAEYLLKKKLTNAEFLCILVDFADNYKSLFADFINKKMKEVRE